MRRFRIFLHQDTNKLDTLFEEIVLLLIRQVFYPTEFFLQYFNDTVNLCNKLLLLLRGAF